MQLARSVLLTYVDFTVVLPGKILFGICFSAANCCVTDLEDKAGDDHDQNGDISHLAWAKTRPSTTSTASSPMPVRAQPPALQLKPAVREPGHGIPVPNHHHCKPFTVVAVQASLETDKKKEIRNEMSFFRSSVFWTWYYEISSIFI